jgi:hypothetical protein
MTGAKHTGLKTKEEVMAIQRETAKRLVAAGRISAAMAHWALKQTGHTAEQIKEIIDVS